ncbi:acyl carrier protein [Polymorphospora rubra]|uniref:Uncharacterized protein n=1 Tax=Polymorphospora rubra TaxID=338584 RepID=A0A810N6N6_9ACTN|nr:acyl carrier protein [Polymorphospora rubra]BCJ67438.1 hypothetical protein Prubr_44590 [Polymorphospora rubra]
MTGTAPMPTRSREWTPVLDGLRADLLDCLQVNLAAVADRAAGPGAHLALGAPLRFVTTAGPLGLPVLTASVERRLDEAAGLLGLRVDRRWTGVSGADLRELARDHGPLYVVGDAFTMPWLPYAGHEHMEHSFLLADAGPQCVVADGYHNSTRWGDARPGVWRLPAADLDAAVPAATAMTLTVAAAPEVDRAAVLRENAADLAAAQTAVDDYLDRIRARAGEPAVAAQIVLDVWLLGRSRALHAAWLAATATHPPDAAATDPPGDRTGELAAHADSWLALAGQSYVAMRRAARGGAFPAAVLDRYAELLHTDVVLAGRLVAGAAAPPPSADGVVGPAAVDPARIRAVLAAEFGAVLGLEPEAVAGRPLRELPRYNSFRLVDVIERAEERLGVQLDPDDLTVTALRDLDSLCGVFGRARPVPEGVPRW